jgi:hypothetical protein
MSLGRSHRTLHLTLTVTLASSVGRGGLCPGGVRKPPPPSQVTGSPTRGWAHGKCGEHRNASAASDSGATSDRVVDLLITVRPCLCIRGLGIRVWRRDLERRCLVHYSWRSRGSLPGRGSRFDRLSRPR